DHVRLTRADVLLRPVAMGDVHRPGQDHADMVHLAALRAGDRLDALRPAPTRLQGHAGSTRPTHADYLDLRLVGAPRLVGRRQVTTSQPGHWTLLLSWMDPAAILNRRPFCANLCLLSSSQPVRLGCGQGPLSEGSSLAIQTQADAYEIACRLLDNIET